MMWLWLWGWGWLEPPEGTDGPPEGPVDMRWPTPFIDASWYWLCHGLCEPEALETRDREFCDEP
jgi:hypothetical protein